MRTLFDTLKAKLTEHNEPFLLGRSQSLSLDQIVSSRPVDLSALQKGDVVALVGGFDPVSISTLLHLWDMGMIVVPLTPDTQANHENFFVSAHINAIIQDGQLKRLSRQETTATPLDSLRARGEAGLILFTSGTTGMPKAILHSAGHFLARYSTPRKPLRTMAFLRFDHIGGINTLLHMLFNNGQVVVPASMNPDDVMTDLKTFQVELFPTTPTYLRLLLLHGHLDDARLPDLKLITYGTERMDQSTLDCLCATLPNVDYRQTYGMSELGILRIKSRARDSLWMQVGGEGVSCQVREGVLHIRAEHRMLGYLNTGQPFDKDGWYCTGDMVDTDGDWVRITGRTNEQINVGGLKVMPGEIEKAALEYPGVILASAFGKSNPITGMHVELTCQLVENSNTDEMLRGLKTHLKKKLPAHAVPQRITLSDIPINHRFKKK